MFGVTSGSVVNWSRFSNPTRATCPVGPDVVMHAPADQLADVSWQSATRRRNPKSKVVVPERMQGGWDSFYVRTALIRASNWRDGSTGPVVKTPERALEILQHLGYLDHERLVTLSLDSKWKLLAIHEASVGGLHGCGVTPRDVLRVPLLVGAERFLIAHNHPSGNPEPSREDLHMTEALFQASKAVGLQFVDHLTIVHGRQYRSISEVAEGLGFDIGGKAARLRPPAADTMFRAELDPVAMATRPYGKYDKFVVRTAMIEAPNRQPGPVLKASDSVARLPPIRALSKLTSEAMVVLCISGSNRLLAINVRVGLTHDVGVQSIYGVAVTVPTSALIIAHNHLEDASMDWERGFANVISRGLDLVGTPLVDSIVVVPGSTRSVMH